MISALFPGVSNRDSTVGNIEFLTSSLPAKDFFYFREREWLYKTATCTFSVVEQAC
jgi:hypothetical protein